MSAYPPPSEENVQAVAASIRAQLPCLTRAPALPLTLVVDLFEQPWNWEALRLVAEILRAEGWQTEQRSASAWAFYPPER